jgi:serine protease Do
MVAPMSFSSLVKASDPAVVTIFAFTDERRGGRRRRVAEGLGSGFVYEPSGYILTNNHVVAQATEIVVRLADERRLPARLVGRDPSTDVAVLKIDVTAVPFLPLGDSNAIDIGDWVVAIGNPFGLSHTVSAGIISAKGRSREDLSDLDRTGRSYFNFLQTDTAINQGNSGGPLLNVKGEVVGINTAIRANANNIGFAIPINMVKTLAPLLVRDGKIKRSALGITVLGVREEDVARLKRPDRKGALVHGVQPGGPADKAGLAEDDVILSFNGNTISDPEELRWQASIAGIGTVTTVKVARGDRVFDVKVTLGALPDEPDDGPAPSPRPPSVPGFP